MVTGSSSTLRSRWARPAPRGLVGDIATPMVLTTLLLMASASPWFLLPLSGFSALTGCMRTGARRGALAVLLSAACAAGAVIVQVTTLRGVLMFAAIAVAAAVFPWTLGAVWRARQDSREAAAALEAQREDARMREADARRSAERALLAEELHDDLGHVLSLVALNLGRLELDPDTKGAARAAITQARTHVSDAVARLGHSVEALRGDEPPALMSRHKQADIEELFASFRAAGAVVEVAGQPPAERLADFGSQTVYRTVQEGITNAVKHAPGQPVAMKFTDTGNRLEITITNLQSQRGGIAAPGAGSGLVGLGERVRLAGGQMRADDGADVFSLIVSLPRAGSVVAPDAGITRPISGPPATMPKPRPRYGADHRFRVRVWIAAVAPLTILIAIATAISLVDVVDARRAELDAATFAKISLGQSRAEAEALLPAHEVEAGEDPGDCHRYAVTSNPLADAAGDYFRICFDDDAVTKVERVEDGAHGE